MILQSARPGADAAAPPPNPGALSANETRPAPAPPYVSEMLNVSLFWTPRPTLARALHPVATTPRHEYLRSTRPTQQLAVRARIVLVRIGAGASRVGAGRRTAHERHIAPAAPRRASLNPSSPSPGGRGLTFPFLSFPRPPFLSFLSLYFILSCFILWGRPTLLLPRRAHQPAARIYIPSVPSSVNAPYSTRARGLAPPLRCAALRCVPLRYSKLAQSQAPQGRAVLALLVFVLPALLASVCFYPRPPAHASHRNVNPTNPPPSLAWHSPSPRPYRPSTQLQSSPRTPPDARSLGCTYHFPRPGVSAPRCFIPPGVSSLGDLPPD
ncbi:hypothetical protein B0H17DRAFT_1211456 [Mycena rosella]|uniref:Uncharacterized protein n=1 Tax=Mycena rosella TaxID=1033263 RepID=A0AAD7CUD9_MYCRO|nr:hypothetical protein B0H17DRAFT_1211456 [Mycena rosella]